MAADATVSGTWNANAYAGTFKNTFTLDAATQILVKGSNSIEFGAGAIMSLNDVVNVKSTAPNSILLLPFTRTWVAAVSVNVFLNVPA